MNNVRIAEVFDEIGDLLEFGGANAFRVRAYRNAARTIKDLPEPIVAIVEDPERNLTDIEGIGKDLAAKIISLVETDDIPQWAELRAQYPPTVLTLLRIPGLGPKKAALLYKELNVQSLEDLRAACEQGKVRQLKGFAAKTEATILAGLEIAANSEVRLYWAKADVYAQQIKSHLAGCPAVSQVEVAGSYRRGRETIGDLDFLVVSTDVRAVMDHFGQFDPTAAVLGRGETKMSVRLGNSLQVDLRVVPEESFGAALQYFTGSKDHNVIVRQRAKNQGLKINEYGVYRGEEVVAGRGEEEVYAALGLPCFPPELREARREFEWADAGKLPDLIQLSDLRGDLHMHTTASDGRGTLAEMVAAAQEQGLQYIAITDHSKRVSMAHGLDGKRLREQWAEIDRLNATLAGFQVLKGVECDILERGGLDIEDEVLAEADWVICSIHYGQRQSRQQITERILEAIEHPHVAAIAHPTGRLINRRPPYEVDLDTVIRAAARYGKLLELNSNPARLDLDDVACAAAQRHGVPIVISSDAHSTEGLNVQRYGILQARRGGLTATDVANTRSWPELRQLIGRTN